MADINEEKVELLSDEDLENVDAAGIKGGASYGGKSKTTKGRATTNQKGFGSASMVAGKASVSGKAKAERRTSVVAGKAGLV